MEILVGIVVAACLVVMAWLSLRADMSERFSVDWQRRNQTNCMSLYDLPRREAKLRAWVLSLAATTIVGLAVSVVSLLVFLGEDAKGYGNANDTLLGLGFAGMPAGLILAIFAVYHAAGMAVRLKAWRLVMSEHGSDQVK